MDQTDFQRNTKANAVSKISSVVVYCGSRIGMDTIHRQTAERLGRIMAEEGLRLVYGGGSIGLMGVLARTILDHGGEVVGIIPHHLDKVEIAQEGLTELHVVDNMHVRKRMMFDRADAFVALPGGLGTLDEFIEVTTWAQLALHDKPILLVNYGGYWNPLIEMIRHIIDQGFASPESTDLFMVLDSVDDIVPALRAAIPPLEESRPDLI